MLCQRAHVIFDIKAPLLAGLEEELKLEIPKKVTKAKICKLITF
jgi:hypothetical protein